MGANTLSSRAIIGRFYATLVALAGKSWVDKLSMLFDSDQDSETYKWLGMVPAMREWVGGRDAKGFRENGITIVNKDFEATLEVLTKEIRRDKTGQVMVRINELARRTVSHWASLLSTLILSGTATACYDGQYFFDTDHSEGDSGTQDNDLSIDISALPAAVHGSTTLPSPEEMQQCILQAVAAILGFKDDQGEPFNEDASEFLVMVPTSLYLPARAALTMPLKGYGETSQVDASGFDIKVAGNPRLSSWTASFGVFRTDAMVKPFIRQEEDPVSIDAVAEGSELEFNEKKHHYGVSASRNVGFGYWQEACLVTMT
jgi:phage major head subunit gpT-like protein